MPENNDLLYQAATNQGNWPNLETGQDTVTTAGTAVPLNGGESLTVPDGASLAIRANSDNSNTVYIGDSSVDSSTGLEKTPGDGVSLNVTDVSTVYVDADGAGDGVSWIVEVDE